MEAIQATSYSLFGYKKTVSGMRAKNRRTAIWYGAVVLNSDGTVLDNRHSWDINNLYRWLESFGFDVSIDAAIIG